MANLQDKPPVDLQCRCCGSTDPDLRYPVAIYESVSSDRVIAHKKCWNNDFHCHAEKDEVTPLQAAINKYTRLVRQELEQVREELVVTKRLLNAIVNERCDHCHHTIDDHYCYQSDHYEERFRNSKIKEITK